MALTADRLREVLAYDPVTGIFTWIKLLSNRVSVGDVAGTTAGSHGYVSIGVDGTAYLGHRLAWLWMTGEWPESLIDHKNFIHTDNRWVNLREANDAENSRHKRLRSDSRSGVRGVTFHKQSGKWRSSISFNKKRISLGLYHDKFMAGAAFQEAATRFYGKFDGVVR